MKFPSFDKRFHPKKYIQLPPGTKIIFNGISLGEIVNTANMTDDEKIDYYESKKIFKLYGVEL